MQYLSLPRFVRAKLLTFLENFLGITKKDVSNKHTCYTFIKHPKAINFRRSSSVGIFKDSKDEKYFIKDYAYSLEDLDYEYVSNEANTLKALSSIKLTHSKVKVPKLINFSDEKNRLTLVTEFIDGNTIGNMGSLFIQEKVTEALKFLIVSIENIPPETRKNIPVRRYIFSFISWPFYLIRAYIKEPNQRKIMHTALKIFLNESRNLIFTKADYGINHRDLSPDNILFNKKNKIITIIDTECMVVGDRLYDLALLPRLYVDYLKPYQFIEIFKSFRLNRIQKKRLMSLMISATIIKIATEAKNTRDYNYALKALPLIVNKIIPELSKQ